MDKKQDVIKTLKKYNQDHIIKLLEKLDMEKQNELIEQIQTINFEQIMELYNNTKKDIEFKESKIEPLKYLDKAKLTEMQRKRFDELGEKAVKNGEYAVVTMAGGQGTRLGHQGPKGTFKLDVFGKGKYLFEILAENLKEANQKYGITIPWYIMTSKEDILSRLSAIFDEGELTEEKVKIVEDISDTFDELSRASGDVEEVEKKWRKRYIERFGSPKVEDEGEKIEETETIKIDDLFEEEGDK